MRPNARRFQAPRDSQSTDHSTGLRAGFFAHFFDYFLAARGAPSPGESLHR